MGNMSIVKLLWSESKGDLRKWLPTYNKQWNSPQIARFSEIDKYGENFILIKV